MIPFFELMRLIVRIALENPFFETQLEIKT